MQLSSVNLDNYAGLWAVEPVHFNQLIQHVNRMDLAAHVAAQVPKSFDPTAKHFESTGGGSVAVINVHGTMTKAGSSIGGGGMVEARHAIRQADDDPSVSSIIVHFDTPGGSVAGTADLLTKSREHRSPPRHSLRISARLPVCGWLRNAMRFLPTMPQQK